MIRMLSILSASQPLAVFALLRLGPTPTARSFYTCRVTPRQVAYQMIFIDEARPPRVETASSKSLASDFELHLPQRGNSLLVRYQSLNC
jgi:hypothetical protein